MKRVLILFLAIASLIPRPSYAGTAASCSQADVQAEIDTVEGAGGGTVTIPTGTCTWTGTTSAINIDGGQSIELVGSGNGVGGTVITDATTVYAIRIVASFGKSYRLSNFRLVRSTSVANGSGNDNTMVLVAGATLGLRVDSMYFSQCGQPAANPKHAIRTHADGYFEGVIHNNTFVFSGTTVLRLLYGGYPDGASYTFGAGAWLDSAQWGSTRFLFIEDNTFDARPLTCAHGSNAPTILDVESGARLVVRFNTILDANGGAALHGTGSGGQARSPRALELYQNRYVHDAGSDGMGGFVPGEGLNANMNASQHRGGQLMMWGNTFSRYTGIVSMLTERGGGNFSVWQASDGTNPLDLNDGAVYWSGVADAGSSGRTLVDTDNPTPWTADQLMQGGYSVRDCNALADSACLVSGAAVGSFVISNTTTTVVTRDTPAGIKPNFQPGDRYVVLRATRVIDVPGRGAGRLVTGAIPVCQGGCPPWVNQEDEPVYLWRNKLCTGVDCTPTALAVSGGPSVMDSGLYTSVGAAGPWVVRNRDVYEQASATIDTTVGVSVGTLAQRPETCTAGVGYWATDQGDWNDNPDAVVDSTNPLEYADQGILYKCTGDAWAQHYKPAPYPYQVTVSAVPTFTNLTPTSGTRTDATVAVTLTGTGFNAGSFAISFSGCTGVDDSGIAGATDIERTANFTISASASGVCDVTVTTVNGTSTVRPFTVTAPSLTSIDPPSGNQNSDTGITIVGTTLGGASEAITVTPDDGVVVEDLVCSATSCTANLAIAADATPGVRVATFESFDGDAPEELTFEVILDGDPLLEVIIPETCYRGANCRTRFEGSGLTGTTLVKTCSDSVMTLSNIEVVNDGLIMANVVVPSDAIASTCGFQATGSDAPTFVAADVAAATSITIPAHSAGQLILMFAFNNATSAPCTVPSGWTEIVEPIGQTNFTLGVYYRIAEDGTTVSGTWTSCDGLGVAVFSGQSSSPIGSVTASLASGTTATYPSNTYEISDGTSLAVAFGCARVADATFASTAPTGMTNRDSAVHGSTAASCGLHTKSASSGWAGGTVSVTSSRTGTFIVEIQGAGLSNPLTLTPLQPAGGPGGVLRAR